MILDLNYFLQICLARHLAQGVTRDDQTVWTWSSLVIRSHWLARQIAHSTISLVVS